MAAVASTSASSSSALVTVLSDSSFADQVLDVAHFLSRSKPEAERSNYISGWTSKAESGNDAPENIVEELVKEVKGLGEGNDRELEGAHNLLSAMIASLTDAQASEQLVSQHVSAIVKDTTQGKEIVKYRILSNIFNSLTPTSATRETVFLALLDLTASNDDLDLLAPSLLSLPNWLSQWSIPESRKAAALEAVASRLEASDSLDRAYEFRLAHLKYLSTTPGVADDAVTKSSAEKAIASALKLPKVFEFDSLLRLSAVETLQQSTPAVYALVKVLAQGSLADWQSWSSQNGSELSRLEIDQAQVERKVRLLELASVCSKSLDSGDSAQGSKVPYSTIAEAIQVQANQVESWVIDLIRAGLVSGKLSQVSQTFRVYRCTYRTFGKEQWMVLERRLAEWDTTIEGILETLSSPRGGNAGQVTGVNGIDGALASSAA